MRISKEVWGREPVKGNAQNPVEEGGSDLRNQGKKGKHRKKTKKNRSKMDKHPGEPDWGKN